MKPLVSICIPVYGVEYFVGKCCRSLFEQTYTNIEYIFVDDCTPDASVEIIKQVLYEYPHRQNMVKIIRHEHNKGLSCARNTAIANVSGQYLMHVDSDDYLDLNVVENLVNKAQSANADVVLYDMRYVYSDRQVIVHQNVPSEKVDCVIHTLIYKMSVCVCGGLYLSTLFKDTGVQFVDGLNFGEDYVVKPRILYYARKIVHCEGCYYNYVQYNTASYTIFYKPKNIDDLIKAMNLLDAFFKEKKDYWVYKDALVLAHWHIKIKLLIATCLHISSVGNRLQMVAELYNELDKPRNMSYSYKLLLWLANHGWHKMLVYYVRFGYSFKQYLKRLR